jgi:Family of unknown function (DUF6600)
MRAKTFARLLAAGLVIAPASVAMNTLPAAAQTRVQISFGRFYSALAPYGVWYHHPRWGDVWHPVNVPRDFHPYSRGHWVNTDDYGWLWVSDYEWGDIAFHYGRWVYDPYDGWLWIPGYIWAPAWVVWREGDRYIGWFPMPPDDTFLTGYGLPPTAWDWNGGFGYVGWYGPQILPTIAISWTFVDFDHFTDRDVYRYEAPHSEYRRLIDNTRNVTNYVTVNNRIVDRSINVNRLERATGRRIAPVRARTVLRVRAPITRVDVGRRIQLRERRAHGGNPNASARARVERLPRSAINAPGNGPAARRFNRNEGRAVQPSEVNPTERRRQAQERAINERRQRLRAPSTTQNERGAPFGLAGQGEAVRGRQRQPERPAGQARAQQQRQRVELVQHGQQRAEQAATAGQARAQYEGRRAEQARQSRQAAEQARRPERTRGPRAE